jgi:hypothetical protein
MDISIPIVISGMDDNGRIFSECVSTLAINKHGGKIAMTHPVAINTALMVENPARGVSAAARVVWLGEKDDARELHYVGFQFLEPQNVWGITFPPDDWRPESER